MSNRLYDQLKWLVLVFLPALAVLVDGLGQSFSWEASQRWVNTINLIAVFIGTLIQISSNHYHRGGGNYAVSTYVN